VGDAAITPKKSSSGKIGNEEAPNETSKVVHLLSDNLVGHGGCFCASLEDDLIVLCPKVGIVRRL